MTPPRGRRRGPGVAVRPQKTALLVAEQIVEDIARRGTTVGDRLPPEHLMLQFEHAPFSTIMEARAVMKPSIARLAARRMSPEALEGLRANVEALRADNSDTAVFTAESERFHALVAWGSGNALFGYLFDAMVGILAGATMGVEYPRRQRDLTCSIHEGIYAAIADRDADAASELMSRHISEHTTYLEKRFRSALERPIRWDLGR